MDDKNKQQFVTEGVPLSDALGVPTKEYRLRKGYDHTHDGMQLEEGDVVHLNKEQAAAMRDRFDAVNPSEEFKVHDAETHKKVREKLAERALSRSGVAPVRPGDEAAQAQADKATAERKYGEGVLGPETPSYKSTQGTLKKDPGPQEEKTQEKTQEKYSQKRDSQK